MLLAPLVEALLLPVITTAAAAAPLPSPPLLFFLFRICFRFFDFKKKIEKVKQNHFFSVSRSLASISVAAPLSRVRFTPIRFEIRLLSCKQRIIDFLSAVRQTTTLSATEGEANK